MLSSRTETDQREVERERSPEDMVFAQGISHRCAYFEMTTFLLGGFLITPYGRFLRNDNIVQGEIP
ncbi:MAG: hypothetical protein DRP58_12915 [Spirochaetes bacterium]|nr:MAG: hypothetical protein DRP58_12915 [Spirochaetota bacterium]